MKLKKIKVGLPVVVYDWYRFAYPVLGVVEEIGEAQNENGVKVELVERTKEYGSVWVDHHQLRRFHVEKGQVFYREV